MTAQLTYQLEYPRAIMEITGYIWRGPYNEKDTRWFMRELEYFMDEHHLNERPLTEADFKETHVTLHNDRTVPRSHRVYLSPDACKAMVKDPSVETLTASRDEIIAFLLQNAIFSMHNNGPVIARLTKYGKGTANLFVCPRNMPMIGLAMQTGRPVVVTALIDAGADIENKPFSFSFIRKRNGGCCKGKCPNLNCNFKMAAALMIRGAYPRIGELDMCPLGFNKLAEVMHMHVGSRLAICMGLHARVGDKSPMRYLNEDLLRKIAMMAGIGVEPNKGVVMGEPVSPRVEWLPPYIP